LGSYRGEYTQSFQETLYKALKLSDAPIIIMTQEEIFGQIEIIKNQTDDMHNFDSVSLNLVNLTAESEGQNSIYYENGNIYQNSRDPIGPQSYTVNVADKSFQINSVFTDCEPKMEDKILNYFFEKTSD
jgi:hypothetical protein